MGGNGSGKRIRRPNGSASSGGVSDRQLREHWPQLNDYFDAVANWATFESATTVVQFLFGIVTMMYFELGDRPAEKRASPVLLSSPTPYNPQLHELRVNEPASGDDAPFVVRDDVLFQFLSLVANVGARESDGTPAFLAVEESDGPGFTLRLSPEVGEKFGRIKKESRREQWIRRVFFRFRDFSFIGRFPQLDFAWPIQDLVGRLSVAVQPLRIDVAQNTSYFPVQAKVTMKRGVVSRVLFERVRHSLAIRGDLKTLALPRPDPGPRYVLQVAGVEQQSELEKALEAGKVDVRGVARCLVEWSRVFSSWAALEDAAIGGRTDGCSRQKARRRWGSHFPTIDESPPGRRFRVRLDDSLLTKEVRQRLR